MGVVRSVGWALSLFRSVLQIECCLVGFLVVKFAYPGLNPRLFRGSIVLFFQW